MRAINEVINMVRLGDKFRKIRAYGIIRGRTNNIKNPVGSGRYKMKRSPFILYWKGGPTFKEKTAQQKKIAEIGRKCGEQVRGIKDWNERKKALRECVLKEFGKI